MTDAPLFKNYFRMFRNYADFSGRSDRGEFWWAMCLHYLLTVSCRLLLRFLAVLRSAAEGSKTGISLCSGLISLLLTLYLLVSLIPRTALTVRRLHDIERSGWWSLIAGTGVGIIVLLIWLCQEGTEDTNLFGSDPHPIRQY